MAEQPKKPINEPEKNLILDDERDLLMDHEYDGIQELDNNMPPWWLYGFYVTIVFAVGYLLYYDVLGWGLSQEEEYQREIAMAAERFGIQEVEARDFSQAVLLTDAASLARGREVFTASTNLCATCHGQNAQGLVGPDLTNDYWKHGCDLQSIMVSISDGFPNRGMPAYGSTVRIGDDDLLALASYIVSLRGSNPAGAKAPDMSRSVRCEEPADAEAPAAEE